MKSQGTTRSVFDRYNIVSEDDLKAAAKAVESYLYQATAALQSQVAEMSEAKATNPKSTGKVRAKSDLPRQQRRKRSGAK